MTNLPNELKQVKQLRTKFRNKIAFIKSYLLELQISVDRFDNQIELLNERIAQLKKEGAI